MGSARDDCFQKWDMLSRFLTLAAYFYADPVPILFQAMLILRKIEAGWTDNILMLLTVSP